MGSIRHLLPALYTKLKGGRCLKYVGTEGSGYPRGLKGEDIPLSGRIMNICDQYDALRSRRPYKAPYTHETTLKIISEGDGRTMPQHFDPHILSAFQACAQTFQEIFATHTD